MKTFDKKNVFSWANCEEVTINTWGYFGESLNDLKREIKEDQEHQLLSIDTEDSYCFKYVENDTRISCPFFLPADKVKEVEEKKYRPFKSIDEFKKETRLDLLSIVHYRYIIEKPRTLTTIGFGVITDFNTCNDDTYYITIGDTSFNLNELFDYEYVDEHGDWQPFGVKE